MEHETGEQDARIESAEEDRNFATWVDERISALHRDLAQPGQINPAFIDGELNAFLEVREWITKQA